MRNQSVPGKRDRLSGINMSKHGPIRFEDLPLFATDSELSEALLGPGCLSEWKALCSRMERRGFPKTDLLMGGRYMPDVRGFFDYESFEYDGSAPLSVIQNSYASGRRSLIVVVAGLMLLLSSDPAWSSVASFAVLCCSTYLRLVKNEAPEYLNKENKFSQIN
jgi:hypothetical protein